MTLGSSFSLVLVGGLSWIGCRALVSLAPRLGLVPEPQLHSAHERPTPVGGGIAVVGGIVLTASGMVLAGILPLSVLAILGAGLPVALVGWLDDRRPLTPLVRLPVHLASSALALAVVGFPSSLLAVGAILLLMTWSINLYNFMDGIDGLAGGQTLLVGLAGGLLLIGSGMSGEGWLALATAAAAGGFLYWNYPPARIFLGDVGSGYLGYIFGALAVGSHLHGGPSILLWMTLLGVFGFDATITLLRRIRRGDLWYVGHREHAYQRAVRAGFTHGQVAVALFLVTAGLGALALVSNALGLPPLSPLAVATLLLTAGYLSVEWLLPLGYGSYDAPSAETEPSPPLPHEPGNPRGSRA